MILGTVNKSPPPLLTISNSPLERVTWITWDFAILLIVLIKHSCYKISINVFIHSFIHSLIQGTGIESFPDEIPKHATAADASAATSNEPPRYRRWRPMSMRGEQCAWRHCSAADSSTMFHTCVNSGISTLNQRVPYRPRFRLSTPNVAWDNNFVKETLHFI